MEPTFSLCGQTSSCSESASVVEPPVPSDTSGLEFVEDRCRASCTLQKSPGEIRIVFDDSEPSGPDLYEVTIGSRVSEVLVNVYGKEASPYRSVVAHGAKVSICIDPRDPIKYMLLQRLGPLQLLGPAGHVGEVQRGRA